MTDRTVLVGDCLVRLAALEPDSVDACVTDPPYGLGFMGKKWDQPGALVERQADTSQAWDHVGGNHNPANSADAARTRLVEGRKFQHFSEAWARAVLRVLKPGAHLLAFGGTRTQHRLTCALEDAGFEIRDCLMWLYGSGFPKSLDVSKAIDKAAGAERATNGVRVYGDGHIQRSSLDKLAPPIGTFVRSQDARINSTPATPSAQQWQGWGTALKPAYEPIILARKPLAGTVAANVQQYGTGALNVDGCRIGTSEIGAQREKDLERMKQPDWRMTGGSTGSGASSTLGRWPSNIIHDGSEEVVGLFPQTSSGARIGSTPRDTYGWLGSISAGGPCEGSSGSAARFFYCAKASRAERGDGNTHPTVKPRALLRYLVRLITPPHGLVLDPFAGSGSTAIAALAEGCRFLGIEQDTGHTAIADARIGQDAALPFGAANTEG